jgi:hypothetical protein
MDFEKRGSSESARIRHGTRTEAVVVLMVAREGGRGEGGRGRGGREGGKGRGGEETKSVYP